jgi:cell division protein FtsQ
VSGLAATLARRSPRRVAAQAVRGLSPRFKRRLLALLVLSVVLAGGYHFWLRDSSLVAVEEVTITGLTTDDADRLRSALSTAGRTMTTLHLDRAALDRAVAGYPVVRGLEVEPEFPHALHVHVIEHQPAAMAVSDAGNVPVAGDGTLLRGLAVEGELPTVDVEGALGDARLLDPVARGGAAVAGAAPAVLRARIDVVTRSSNDDGYVAVLRDGPELIFGSATRLQAKWAAAARVLADLDSRGASYVDLRIPGRPAVGGLAATTLAPVAPAGTDFGTEQSSGTEPVTDPSATTATETPTTTTEPTTTEPTITEPEVSATPDPSLTAGTGGGATAAP